MCKVFEHQVNLTTIFWTEPVALWDTLREPWWRIEVKLWCLWWEVLPLWLYTWQSWCEHPVNCENIKFQTYYKSNWCSGRTIRRMLHILINSSSITDTTLKFITCDYLRCTISVSWQPCAGASNTLNLWCMCSVPHKGLKMNWAYASYRLGTTFT